MLTFESLLVALARADVRFLVVGGLAVAQAGHARFTEDVDLLVDDAPANLDGLLATLAGLGDGAARELSRDDFPPEEGAVRIVDEFPIDLFTRMSGHAYADLLPLSVSHSVGGTPVRFLGAEGLLRLKADSLRPRDRADADALRALLASRPPDA